MPTLKKMNKGCHVLECELQILLLWHKNTIPPQDKNANFVQTMLHIHTEQQYS